MPGGRSGCRPCPSCRWLQPTRAGDTAERDVVGGDVGNRERDRPIGIVTIPQEGVVGQRQAGVDCLLQGGYHGFLVHRRQVQEGYITPGHHSVDDRRLHGGIPLFGDLDHQLDAKAPRRLLAAPLQVVVEGVLHAGHEGELRPAGIVGREPFAAGVDEAGNCRVVHIVAVMI